MNRPYLRFAAAAAVVVLLCAVIGQSLAATRPLPSGFRAESLTATNDRDWWLEGHIPCRFRHGCVAVIRTLDGGRTFTRVRVPTLFDVEGNRLAQFAFPDPRNGYIAADRLWVTHDGGHHWRAVALGGQVSTVAAAGGFVYAIVANHPRGRLMRSPVGHDHWSVLAEAPDGFVNGIAARGGTVLLDKSVTLGGEQVILVSHDDGAHFTASRPPLLETGCLPQEPVQDTIWMLCRGGMMDGLYRSTDGGLSFAPPSRPTAGSQNSSGVWPGDATLAAASATTAVVAGQQLFRTTDGGSVFRRVPLPTADGGWDVAFIDDTHGLALGRFGQSADPPGRLYVTGDGGASYHSVPIRPAGTAAAASAGHGTAHSPCSQIPEEVEQSPDGRVSGCFHLEGLRAGHYRVSLQATLYGKRFCACSPSAREPAVQLTLSPRAGPPGADITVRGRVARPISAQGRDQFAGGLGDFMWDGAPPQGLMLLGARIEWTSPEEFTASVKAPAAPWVEGGNALQVLGLRSGSFPISVHCITGAGGCAIAQAEGSADFRLEVEHPPFWCQSQRSCAALAVAPVAASPGANVQISGHAPLVEYDDGAGSFVGTITLTPGAGGADVTLIRDRRGHPFASLGAAPFDVLHSAAYSSLGRTRVLWELADGTQPLAGDPADPGIVAWCGSGALTVSDAGVATTIRTAGALAPLRAEGMYEPAGSILRCDAVLPLGARTMLAAFGGEVGKNSGIWANFPAQTRDGGRTWTPLPWPSGSNPSLFGGFRATAATIEAVYASRVPSGNGPQVSASRPLVETSSDDGVHWAPSSLGCPSSGPCLTLGPFLPGNCAMGVSTQFVLRSTDGGGTWRDARILDPAKLACGDTYLVATGAHSALLVDALSDYPLQRTLDGGASWQNVSLPSPGRLTAPGALQDFGPGGFTLLPDGGLLLTGGFVYSGGWQLLAPSAHRWCPVRGHRDAWQRAPQATAITVIGPDLWWLSYGNTPAHGPTATRLHELPLSMVRCA